MDKFPKISLFLPENNGRSVFPADNSSRRSAARSAANFPAEKTSLRPFSVNPLVCDSFEGCPYWTNLELLIGKQ